MPDPIHPIPLAEIDAASLTRDRTALDPEALRELRNSILKSGLRMPIEVYALPDPAARTATASSPASAASRSSATSTPAGSSPATPPSPPSSAPPPTAPRP